MWLLVGLGNPGREYETTRHNIGFLTLDYITDQIGEDFSNKKFKGLYTSGKLHEQKFIFLKPQTYMNLSGESLQSAASYYKIPKEKIIVIHDDMDLPFEMIRIKKGGGHGGHNGLRSIMSHTGSEFNRIRLGIHRPTERTKVNEHVLGNFNDTELDSLEKIFANVSKAIQLIISEGIETAQQKYNNKKTNKT